MIQLRNTEDFLVDFSVPGTQTAATNKVCWVAPFAGRIKALYAKLGTAGVTGSQVNDISKNGTTIFGTPGIDFATTAVDPTYNALAADPHEFVKGDVFTLDVDSIHTGTAAVNLCLFMTVSRGVSKLAGVLTGAVERSVGPGF
jgi:hypothetical protein